MKAKESEREGKREREIKRKKVKRNLEAEEERKREGAEKRNKRERMIQCCYFVSAKYYYRIDFEAFFNVYTSSSILESL